MALSPMYAAILQDLNKAVAQNQPEDVLQFCANFFNSKLEEQRIAGRASLAEQNKGDVSASAASAKSASTPSKSALASPTSQSSAVKKKVSLPSLVGQGYSFGGLNRDQDFFSQSGSPSPLSEVPPSLGKMPPAPSSLRSSTGPSGNAGGSGGISWSRPFGGASDDTHMHDSDEENSNSGIHDNPYIGNPRGSSESRDRLATLSPNGAALNANRDTGIPTGYNLGRRTSVSAESIDPSTSSTPLAKTVIPKTPSQRSRIESSIEKNLLFRNLDEEQHNDVLNAMKEVRVNKGVEVIVQGAVGDFFYVVESGEFQVWVKPATSSGMITSPPANNAALRARSLSPGLNEEGSAKDSTTTASEDGTVTRDDGSKLVATIHAGGSFGELALMYNAPRAATVVCSSQSATLWALDRITFRTILMEHTSKKRRMYEKFLSEVPILVSLEPHERSKIADALEERIYEEGEDVVREGELGKNFYIIESGRAEVLKRKGGDKQERVGTLSKGDYFGELALLNSAPRAATVRPLPGSGRLRVATLGEKAFTRLLGPVVEILTRRAERNYGSSNSNSRE